MGEHRPPSEVACLDGDALEPRRLPPGAVERGQRGTFKFDCAHLGRLCQAKGERAHAAEQVGDLLGFANAGEHPLDKRAFGFHHRLQERAGRNGDGDVADHHHRRAGLDQDLARQGEPREAAGDGLADQLGLDTGIRLHLGKRDVEAGFGLNHGEGGALLGQVERLHQPAQGRQRGQKRGANDLARLNLDDRVGKPLAKAQMDILALAAGGKHRAAARAA